MKRNTLIPIILAIAFSTLFFLSTTAGAKTGWDITDNIQLDETPIDMAVTKNGSMVYILCEKSICVYSFQENKVSDTISLTENFSKISLSPDEESLFLTNPEKKELTVITLIHDIPIGQSPIIGEKTAPVTIIAFIDYQCPYCARAYPLLEQAYEKYPKKVNIVIKHFPLRMHKFAKQAAIAVLAAEKQGKYAEMSKKLMQNYRTLNTQSINQCAKDIGLNMETYAKDLQDPAITKQMTQDMDTAMRANIPSVPRIFISGKLLKNRSLAGISQMIDTELAKK